MAEEVSISLQNVSKVYKRYHRPADRLQEFLFPEKSRAEEFWAIRDINLEAFRGETVGIIGRNGSGKSTLLQIIAGTLTPTTGQIEINGRVSALLELGSGFNPEFTGRQNVFFNGRILGLSQEEIEGKFDQITAFADIGEFIDQPVKTYSSGMFVRLAFGVAINSVPDILIIDEALSVGDEAFQRKCFAQIHNIREQGACVLFVSHSATSIVELCDTAILVDSGEILLKGNPKTVVSNYQKLIYAPKASQENLKLELKNPKEIHELDDKPSEVASASNGSHKNLQQNALSKTEAIYDPNLVSQSLISYTPNGAKIRCPEIKTLTGNPVNILVRNERYIYSYSVYFFQDSFKVRFAMLIKTISGLEIGGAESHSLGNGISYVPAGSTINVQFEFECNLLPGTYFLNSGTLGDVNGENTYLDRQIDIAMFKVQPEKNILATSIVDFKITSKFSSDVPPFTIHS